MSKNILYLEVPSNLNYKQQKFFNYILNVENFEPIFVSGFAGSGKSALLISLKNYLQKNKKNVMIVTYTHLAARNIGGVTCHSAFRFDFQLQYKLSKMDLPDYLIIDEISMMPNKMLDGIDVKLRHNSTKKYLPFGGVNTIVFGDLYQLPPINSKDNDVLPVYDADIWKSFKLFELTENMRQSEDNFINALDLLRKGDIKCLPFFKSLVINKKIDIKDRVDTTSLVSKHNEADNINKNCYCYIYNNNNDKTEKIIKLKKKLQPRIEDMVVYNNTQRNVIFKEYMKYCLNTKVMITHTCNSFCNGDTGTIIEIKDDNVLIKRDYDKKEMWLCLITFKM